MPPLPLLALQPSQQQSQQQSQQPSNSTAAKRQKTSKSDGDDDVYFKAFKKGEFRQLSNLFGPVEWEFQTAKFKPGSHVREWLLANSERVWTVEQFDAARKAMQHDGKLESYVDRDGTIATGLLAQMCSLIVRNPTSPDARKRLAFILERSAMSAAEAEAWVREKVFPELGDAEKDELMLNLLRKKFATPKYRDLLMRTVGRVLHEAKGRGPPNRYEFHPLTDAQRRENELLLNEGLAPKWSEGGDVLGKLMTIVRSEFLSIGIPTTA